MIKIESIFLIMIFSITALGGTNVVEVIKRPSEQNGLSCKIVFSESSLPHNGRLDAKLVLTNASKKPIRICTLCMGWRSTWKGSFDIRFDPERWKSDSPSLEQSAEEVVTIQPRDSVNIPFEIFLEDGSELHVTASYAVQPEFAQKLDIWHGTVQAESVTVIPKK